MRAPILTNSDIAAVSFIDNFERLVRPFNIALGIGRLRHGGAAQYHSPAEPGACREDQSSVSALNDDMAFAVFFRPDEERKLMDNVNGNWALVTGASSGFALSSPTFWLSERRILY